MTSRYHIKKFHDDELESAVDLMIAEHPVIIRDTPTKMRDLIFKELDVKVDLSRIKVFFSK